VEKVDFVNPIEAAGVEEPVFVYRKPKRVHGGILRVMRWLALGVLILIVTTVGWFGYKALSAAHSIFAKSNGGAPGLAGLLDVTKLKGEGDGRVNILVLGIGGQGHEAPNLSDTMMVISFDPKTKDAAMLSIPRDLYVKIPAGTSTREQYGKINAANAYGGPELAAKLGKLRPGLRVLYMSGYTRRPIANADEPLGAGASFLQKPFTFELLRQKLDILAVQPARNGNEKGPT